MNWALALKAASFLATNLPAITTVVGDVSGILAGTKPANHPNTGASGGVPAETVRSLQKLYNQVFKPATPIKEDGLYGKESETALKAALGQFGVTL